MNIEHNLFGWCRTMCKYGDFILYLDIDEEIGVRSSIALPPHEVERLEGLDSTNPNYVQYQWNSAGMTFENWQIAHISAFLVTISTCLMVPLFWSQHVASGVNLPLWKTL